MKPIDNVIVFFTETRTLPGPAAPGAGAGVDPGRAGLAWGALGVLLFSFTVAATRAAAPSLGGLFVGAGRGVVGGVLGGLWLLTRERRWPERSAWVGLALVAAGGVIGFPVAASVALAHVAAVHGLVLTAFVPALTALLSVLRTGERPSARWWAWTFAGAAVVVGWALRGGATGPEPYDLVLLVAMASAALSYVEGAKLARSMGGLRVIAWALVFGLPVTVPIAATLLPSAHGGATAWGGLLWLGVVSAFLGFGPWYRGLTLGGVARVGQVQTLQPLLGLVWAELLLGERVEASALVAAGLVVGCVAAGARERRG